MERGKIYEDGDGHNIIYNWNGTITISGDGKWIKKGGNFEDLEEFKNAQDRNYVDSLHYFTDLPPVGTELPPVGRKKKKGKKKRKKGKNAKDETPRTRRNYDEECEIVEKFLKEMKATDERILKFLLETIENSAKVNARVLEKLQKYPI